MFIMKPLILLTQFIAFLIGWSATILSALLFANTWFANVDMKAHPVFLAIYLGLIFISGLLAYDAAHTYLRKKFPQLYGIEPTLPDNVVPYEEFMRRRMEMDETI